MNSATRVLLGLLFGLVPVIRADAGGLPDRLPMVIAPEHVEVDRVLLALAAVFGPESPQRVVEFRRVDGKLAVWAADAATEARILEVVRAVDVNDPGMATRFVQVPGIGPGRAVELLERRSRESGWTLRSVADPRTGRVFLMGEPGEIEPAVEALRTYEKLLQQEDPEQD